MGRKLLTHLSFCVDLAPNTYHFVVLLKLLADINKHVLLNCEPKKQNVVVIIFYETRLFLTKL